MIVKFSDVCMTQKELTWELWLLPLRYSTVKKISGGFLLSHFALTFHFEQIKFGANEITLF